MPYPRKLGGVEGGSEAANKVILIYNILYYATIIHCRS